MALSGITHPNREPLFSVCVCNKIQLKWKNRRCIAHSFGAPATLSIASEHYFYYYYRYSCASHGQINKSDDQRSCYGTWNNLWMRATLSLSLTWAHGTKTERKTNKQKKNENDSPHFLMSFLLWVCAQRTGQSATEKIREKEKKNFARSAIKIVMVKLDDGTNKICNEIHLTSFLWSHNRVAGVWRCGCEWMVIRVEDFVFDSFASSELSFGARAPARTVGAESCRRQQRIGGERQPDARWQLAKRKLKIQSQKICCSVAQRNCNWIELKLLRNERVQSDRNVAASFLFSFFLFCCFQFCIRWDRIVCCCRWKILSILHLLVI